jgi:deoxycytidylate deaminase
LSEMTPSNPEPSEKLRGVRERHAYIFRSLKHPDEVRSLRAIYGPNFYLVAAYSPEEGRKSDLASRIAKSRGTPLSPDFDSAERLIERDRSEGGLAWGQNLEATFHLADFFVDVRRPQVMSDAIGRFVQLIFGHPFLTPTLEENAMFHAKAAALRSAEPSRQVGAVVADSDGSLISVGVNEVPKFGGGFYWPGDPNDRREYTMEFDSSEARRLKLVSDTLEHLKCAGWLTADASAGTRDEIARRAIRSDSPPLPKSSMIRNVIEFGRAVHAEMAAITEAARRGVSIAGCTMYATTFPCHLCARHIVAAGFCG